MLFRHSSFYPSIFSAGFLGILIGNSILWHNTLIGGILALAFICVFGSWVGRSIAPTESVFGQWWIGVWMLLSMIMLTGSIAYYLFAITPTISLMIACLIPPISWWLARHSHKGWFERTHDFIRGKFHHVQRSIWMALILISSALTATTWLLIRASTTDAVRSAWQTVSPSIFIAFGCALFLLITILFRGRERSISIPLTILTLFIFLSVVVVVFPLGFGFDPFIHKATEQHIAEFGTITPKPFYYIGQYALIVFFNHAFEIPIVFTNTFLVPILAALLIPLSWINAAGHVFNKKTTAVATLGAVFLIPLSSFILTTPQGLANLWTLLLILAAIPYLVRDEKPRVWPLIIPALATLAIHPIAGLPTVLFVTLLASDPKQNANRLLAKCIFYLTIAIGSVLLPLSFIAQSLLSSGTLGLTLNHSITQSLSSLSLFFANRFSPLLDFIYLYGLNNIAIFILIACIGWFITRKPIHGALRILLIMAVMLMINFLLLSTAVDFSFLIDYERQNFATRLIPLTLFFLTPFFILAVGSLIERVKSCPVSLRVLVIVLLASLSTASWYLSYPRHDAYVTGHGYNVSATDIKTIHGIETDANGTPYIVLANQTVSAAAISELGFAHYYADLFFYPIPTGGDLYEKFLTMNKTPNAQTASEALTLVNTRCQSTSTCTQPETQTLYFVVNNYWWEAPRIVETAKQTADSWWALDNGAVHVFKYQTK